MCGVDTSLLLTSLGLRKSIMTCMPLILSYQDVLPTKRTLSRDLFPSLAHRSNLRLGNMLLINPLLFSVLSFNGNAQNSWYGHTWKLHHYGRKKAAEAAYLAAVVDEVVEMGIAVYVRTFKFSPAFYVGSKLYPPF